MKLLGSLLIILACSLYGFFKAYALKKKCKNLTEIKSIVNTLKSQIGFLKTDLCTAVINASKDYGVSPVFSDFAYGIKTLGVDDSWNESLKKHSSALFFSEQDTEVLKLFSKDLGKTDTDNQLKSLDFFLGLLDELYYNADSQYKLKASIYKSAGTTIGIFVVLMLL